MHGEIAGEVYKKYEKEIGRLRMGGKVNDPDLIKGSWSLLLEEVKGKKISELAYESEKYFYDISFYDANIHGFKHLFDKELKLVIPVKWWKIRDKENNKVVYEPSQVVEQKLESKEV